ncbi:sigma-70 family RNA polymerase sigma factor [Kibdelosporangium philippinense]|uniref:Sigma-70 family RNA polymerase sigma factor n=1 Tax=Kibdelosporangium philippinense TaxID=211113 RepID=A0ABS8ZEN0_9PSEU|nr:sigma-70 family RNA polymerase sigma factor [Kibdelosporangium philippinense]MCE7005365.1 sigma-70 family RNA polymerase sigma factor [Kibdelosporangium philippinense]
MDELAARFEKERPRLRAVAYRMLGSAVEADDAVQDAWLRLSRSDASTIDNLGGWLTTVVARECLHVLRSRRNRREDPVDLVVVPDGSLDPEQEALLADSVGLAMLIVLDQLGPAERLAFVLHDMFQLSFDEIAAIVGRTPAAARQLASRARRRIGGVGLPAPDLARQRAVVHAFYAAARDGDFSALVQVLDPDVVLQTSFADQPPVVVRGASAVAAQARAPRGGQLRPVLVNGSVGALITRDGRPYSVMAFTVAGSRIVRIDVFVDPQRFTSIFPTA